MIYEITIPGEPTAKGRPRFTRTGHAYTPQKTVNYEAQIKTAFFEKYGQPMFSDSLCAEVTAYFAIPKSASKPKREAMLSGELRPTKKPDTDNIAKTVLDALNKIAYNDDAQITRLVVEKAYSDKPRVEAKIITQEAHNEKP